MDVHTSEQRSYNMSQIKGSDTKLELAFRKYVWTSGIRGYRIKTKIIGKPDLYFSKKKIAVFIDGCFWHKCPKDYIRPKSKKTFWDKKIEHNIKRDKVVKIELEKQGIKILRFWEHEIEEDIQKCILILAKRINS